MNVLAFSGRNISFSKNYRKRVKNGTPIGKSVVKSKKLKISMKKEVRTSLLGKVTGKSRRGMRSFGKVPKQNERTKRHQPSKV